MLHPNMKLRNWIDKSKLCCRHLHINKNAVQFIIENEYNIIWDWLALNPNAIHILEQNLDKLYPPEILCSLAENPNALHLIKIFLDNNYLGCSNIGWFLSGNKNSIQLLKNKRYEEFIHWPILSLNPNSIDLLVENSDKIRWHTLSMNPNAIHLLEKNPDKIDWKFLSLNPNAIHILEQNLDKIDWSALTVNPNAIHILEKNFDKIDWGLSCSPLKLNIQENYSAIKNLKLHYMIGWGLSANLKAIHILENNIDKINWDVLSINPNAIHILEQNQNKINWTIISANPAIFMYDRNKKFKEELIEVALNPDRVAAWINAGIKLGDM